MTSPRKIAANRANWAKRRGLSPEGRERLRQAALRHRPWEKATGPRTEKGKRRSRRNALYSGDYAQTVLPYAAFRRAFQAEESLAWKIREWWRRFKLLERELLDEEQRATEWARALGTPLPSPPEEELVERVFARMDSAAPEQLLALCAEHDRFKQEAWAAWRELAEYFQMPKEALPQDDPLQLSEAVFDHIVAHGNTHEKLAIAWLGLNRWYVRLAYRLGGLRESVKK